MSRISCNHLVSITNIPIVDIVNRKQQLVCTECKLSGKSLWICLYDNCLFIGCGENSNDHSTTHNIKQPTHCIHMNLHNKRLWCYKCQSEVFLIEPKSYDSDQEMDNACIYKKAHDSGHGSYATLRTNSPERSVFAFENTVGLNVSMSGDGSDHSDNEDKDDGDVIDRPFGLVGLQNIGNTCYMNSALQALSNAVPLTRFFLECATTVHILSEGKKPGLCRTYQTLVRDIWRKNGGYVTPSGILYGIRSVYPMFRGYYQHDTQEFLRNFMDQLHEELKQVLPAELNDSDMFSLAMDESTISSSYDSSEGEYETCDSGVSERSSLSDDTERPATTNKKRLSRSLSPGSRIRTRLESTAKIIETQPCSSSPNASPANKRQQKYRSIISDIFDGKLLSSVQCLTCDRISSRFETFQDLSLPIPSRDHLVVLHGRPSSPVLSACTETILPIQDGWLTWIFAWLKSWFYGPIVTLHDCLAAFFSTDELKGDNMYSCEKCNKLRNGIKFSKVLQLPEILCIHLKRFRHELMFSSKISSAVSFPLKGLDMRPYLHEKCTSKVTNYELFSVICHYGTAGGGHYICYSLNGAQWYEFDDQYVTRVAPEKVQSCEAYVLFYRKVSFASDEIRNRAIKMAKAHPFNSLNNVAYISKQWLTRFNTCTEPGPIDNSDFLCQHGFIHPDTEICFEQLVVPLALPVYDYLHKKFNGAPPVCNISICPSCLAFNKRILFEMERFVQLNREAQDAPQTHLISTHWYGQWEKFIQNRAAEAPGPIDNSKIGWTSDVNEVVEIAESVWLFFYKIYGGGPEVRVKRFVEVQEDEGERRESGGGEPMDVEETIEGENREMEVVVTTNGVGLKVEQETEVSDEEPVNVEVRNNKRHRRRRKALSSS